MIYDLAKWQCDFLSTSSLDAVASIFVAVDLVVALGGSEVIDSGPGTFLLEMKGTESDSDVAKLAPVLTPGVANDPVLFRTFLAPTNDRDNMVNRFTSHLGDASGVLKNGCSVNTAADRTTSHNLLLHGISAAYGTILSDGSVGILLKFRAEAAVGREGGASASNVGGGALPVAMGTKAFSGFGAAGHVRVRGLIRNTGTRGRDLTKPLIDTSNRATMARSNIGTVENVLDGEVNVNSFSSTGNLDTISECRDCTMCPAGATILGKMLIPTHSAVVNTVLIAPVELVRHCSRRKNILRAGLLIAILFNTSSSFLLSSPDFARTTSSSEGSKSQAKHSVDHL